ncbi:SHOCT domain-containing protein [Nocardioides ochotonae]|uniref:SHOCT domain-containing protein n=1 Tax=Nocardioides ochotonae TaxID=2685869 RepID=UPI0014079DB7|nr:SHOCT domain-containing protein [Nocardioides ochotonae]
MDFWDVFWLIVWSFFFISYLIILFHIVVDLFRDRELSGLAKAMWVLALLVLPALTALVYLVVRGRGMAGRDRQAAEQAAQATDNYIRSVAGTSPAEQIATAKQLLDTGAITEEEYDVLKSRALAAV